MTVTQHILLWSAAAMLAVASSVVHADTTSITIPARSVKTGIAITVPSNAKVMTVKVDGAARGTLQMYLRPDADFPTPSNPSTGAAYSTTNYASSIPGTNGTASLSVGDYSIPALHAGKWYVALANTSSLAANVTLETTTFTSSQMDTQFIINFAAASTALENVWGGADKLKCDVAPWNDNTVSGSTTLGAIRKQLLEDAAAKLSKQVHSPVPVRIQACWKAFDDSGAHAGSYTLAAATGVYSFYDVPNFPLQNTWYSQAPSARLAGDRACNLDSGVDCSIPDIIIWYNSADVAKDNYDDASDEPLITSVTMHEITHGLGFLSDVTVSNPDDCSKDPPPAGTDCNQIGKFWNGRNDAYTTNVAYLQADPAQPFSNQTVVPFAELSLDDRVKAMTSGSSLVWNDTALAASSDNSLRNNPAPKNLVELHAPSTIQPGSTLSHLSQVHVGQLMDAVIQSNTPDTLGLAGPMLERVGWNTGPADVTAPYTPPMSGNWYDTAHSGHGIDFEKVVDDPAGDQYAVIFYTYDSNGRAEYYYSGGRLTDGHYGDATNAGQPAAMGRPVYDPANHKATYPGPLGSLGIDFSAAAANDPACAGNTAAQKAVLSWSINGESGKWCISPLGATAAKPDPARDLTGLWNAGSADSGWGFSILDTVDAGGAHLNPLLVFYYGTDNQPHWAQADAAGYAPGQTVDLYRINGYCRTCSKAPTTHDLIGSMTLNLNTPENVDTPSGSNTVSININGGGTLKFSRNNTAVRTYSLPVGQ